MGGFRHVKYARNNLGQSEMNVYLIPLLAYLVSDSVPSIIHSECRNCDRSNELKWASKKINGMSAWRISIPQLFT